MIIVDKNFSHLDELSIPKADEYINCNFMRPAPDTSGPQPVGIRLWPGDDTPRIFRDCNLINCEPPPGSTIIGFCNTKIVEKQIPDFIDRIVLNGTPIHTRQRTLTRLHGRWNPSTESYEYEPAPVDTPD